MLFFVLLWLAFYVVLITSITAHLVLQQFTVATLLHFQIQEASISKETKQFTYKEGSQFVFMDLVDASISLKYVMSTVPASCLYLYVSHVYLITSAVNAELIVES